MFLLNKVAVSDDPSKPLREQALIDLFNRKLRNGRGYDLIEFLTARRNHREKRAKRRAEIFNEKLLVIALLWTDPQIPLWLMPSAGAVKIVDNVFGPSGGRRLTKQAYNKLCRDNQLQRLEDKRRNRDPMGLFIRLSTQDSEGRDLRRQLETVMGVPLSAVRRGRRKMSAD